MNERDWLTATEPAALLEFMAGKASRRKLRLVGCACCRRVFHLLRDPKVRAQVALGEEVRDEAEYIRVAVVLASELQTTGDYLGMMAIFVPLWSTSTRNMIARIGLVDLANAAANYQVPDAFRSVERLGLPADPTWQKEFDVERARQVSLVREIVGNPFAPRQPLTHVPATVKALAEAVHQQDASAVAPLADALLEADLPELAEHFADPTAWHPKGCWAVDLLTGRE